MQLSDLEFDHLKLVRNGDFSQLDFAHTLQKYSLVCTASNKFVKIANQNSNVNCVITNEECAGNVSEQFGLILSENPYFDFLKLQTSLTKSKKIGVQLDHKVDPTANIHPSAHIELGCQIGKNVKIGAGSVILAGVIIKDNTVIDHNVTIGCDGYFAKVINGEFVNVEHSGGVVIEENCRILSGAIIQKSVFSDFTRIGKSTLISVGVQIGHGVQVGEFTSIAGGAVLAGYSNVGAHSWIGPGAVISDSIKIGQNSRIEIGTVVVKSLSDGSRVSGALARPHSENIRLHAKLSRL